MQYRVNAIGKRIYPSEVKRKILESLEHGKSPHELSREFQIPIQNIFRWKSLAKKGVELTYDSAQPEPMVPLSEHERVVRELEEQLKLAKRSLANMTVDRDILKDAVAIASKKKWI